MEEVIYAGGERRSRASYAEVTMVFDNTAGRLPVDYHEVAIKRRVERDGESDYFLNGTRVRRRDLIHLLASTGLTVDSYAIIDQHDIEHIVVCTPAERRQLLEEAAQVRGVKARRQEAVQKLQELAANLLRLEDLKTELGPRLEALRAQAASKAVLEAAADLHAQLTKELALEALPVEEVAETELAEAERRAKVAEEAAVALARLRSELEGIEALRPASSSGVRLGEVITARAGYEAALAAALGPLLDAMVVADESAAVESTRAADRQVTALFPVDAAEPVDGSRYHHVEIRDGYEPLARRLLGGVVVGRDVTVEGVYREPGMVRSGADPRAALEARRAELQRRIPKLEVDAGLASDTASELRRLREAMERGQMRNRLDSIRRQAAMVEEDLARLTAVSEDRRARVVQAEQAVTAAAESIPDLHRAAEGARRPGGPHLQAPRGGGVALRGSLRRGRRELPRVLRRAEPWRPRDPAPCRGGRRPSHRSRDPRSASAQEAAERHASLLR